MNHVPYNFNSTSYPMVLIDCFVTIYTHKIMHCSQVSIKLSSCYHSFLIFGKATCCIFHYRERFGHYFFKYYLKFIGDIFFYLIYLFPNYFTLLKVNIFYSFLELIYLVFFFRHIVVNAFFHFLSSATKLIIRQFFYFGIYIFD